jgi:hypothetical protein
MIPKLSKAPFKKKPATKKKVLNPEDDDEECLPKKKGSQIDYE